MSSRGGAAAAVALAGAAALAARPAAAQDVGTLLSGPTDGDGASAYWNPAAMAAVRGTRADLGSGFAFIRLGYDPEGETGASRAFVPKPGPTVGVASDLGGLLGPRWRAGLTAAVPYTDGARWPRDGAASDVTRWYIADSRVYHVTVTPAVSWLPHRRVAVGAGLDVVRSHIDADLDKDFGRQLNLAIGSRSPSEPFRYGDADLAGPVSLSATGWSLGAVAGAFARPLDALALGAAVHLPAEARARGDARADYPAAMRETVEEMVPAAELPPLRGSIEVPLVLPLTALAGAAFTPAPRWQVAADYRFVRRSATSNLDVAIVQATSPDLRDSTAVLTRRDRHSFGGRVSRALGRALLAALRLRYEPNTVPETTYTPTNMDFHKWEIGAALRWSLSTRFSLTAQASHYLLRPVHVSDSLHRPLSEPSLDAFNHPSPAGTYTAQADHVGLSLSLSL